MSTSGDFFILSIVLLGSGLLSLFFFYLIIKAAVANALRSVLAESDAVTRTADMAATYQMIQQYNRNNPTNVVIVADRRG